MSETRAAETASVPWVLALRDMEDREVRGWMDLLRGRLSPDDRALLLEHESRLTARRYE